MAIDLKVDEFIRPVPVGVLEIQVTGKLVRSDYKRLVPEIDRLIRHYGKLRVLFDMHDFHGWTVGALWEDVKFDLRHFRDIERLAFVGEKSWEENLATFCRPFTTASIKYFDRAQMDEARKWIKSFEDP